MSEIIYLTDKSNKGREKEAVEELDPWDADCAAWEAEYEARRKFIDRLIEKGAKRLKRKCATRFDVILALIQEGQSCARQRNDISALDARRLPSRQQGRLSHGRAFQAHKVRGSLYAPDPAVLQSPPKIRRE
jgi:hypothetical protein